MVEFSVKTAKLSVKDCNCNAIYGVDPKIANNVTITPNVLLLPYREEIKSAIEVILCVLPMRTSFLKNHHHPTNTIVGPR